MIEQIILLIGFSIISGAVSGSETAFFSYKEKGYTSPKFYSLIEKPYKLLLLVLIINVFVNIGFTSVFDGLLSGTLQVNSLYSFIIITVSILMVGEVVPKAIAINKPLIFIKVMTPIFSFVEKPTSMLMKLFSFLENFFENIKSVIEPYKIEKESMAHLLNLLVNEQKVHELNGNLLNAVLKTDITMCKFVMDDFSKIPEIMELDSIRKLENREVPFVKVNNQKNEIQNLIKLVNNKLVSSSMNEVILGNQQVICALNKMKHFNTDLLLVVDEYGFYVGYLSKERIVEFIFNNIKIGAGVVQHFDDVTFDAHDSVNHINSEYGLMIPEGNYLTMNGYILENLGRIPLLSETFFIDGLKYTILEARSNTIVKIKLERGD